MVKSRNMYGGFVDDNSLEPSVDNSLTSKAKAETKKYSEKMKNFAKSNGIVIIIVGVLILIVIITIWIISIVRKSNFKVVNVSDRIIRLDRSENMPMTFASSKFPVSNGQEFTFSFWLYIADYDTLYDHRILMRRGGSIESINFGNPIVALDAKTNKMYIALKTNRSLDVQNMMDVLTPSKNYVVSGIDYVPLQRWVHVAFSVQDSIFTIFMDGDIYAVKSITDIENVDPINKSILTKQSNTSSRAFFSNTLGDMYIGDSVHISKGFLSRIQYYNYACTQKHMQQIYKAGPVKQSILSLIGLNTYGVRAPIYKMDDIN